MWTAKTDSVGLRQSKHIYVGESRIATKCNYQECNDEDAENPGDGNLSYEANNIYWYHSDHLGSAQFVTDTKGQEHECLEYTPYGELWIERTTTGLEKLPYRFTGKEFDEETGLYYYGARYLDPKYSRWLSADPALGEYIPGAPVSEEARNRNGNLPGMGGVFNTVNFALYHYAGNNPVKYTDPDGNYIVCSWFDSDVGVTRYSMGTFFNKDQFICYVGFAADCAIPFGGFVLQAERGLSNLVDEALCNNFKIEYNSAEGPPDGCSMAVDAAGFFAKASKFLKISSNVFTGFGIFDVAKGVVSDAKIQHFLRITNPLLLKGATSKADAIKFAKQFADGVKAYYDKNLSAKGVSEQDWANAVYDNIHGNKNTLYSSVMEDNK